MAPEIADFNALIADVQDTFPVRRVEATVLPVVLLLGALILFFLLVREVLNTYVPEEKTLKKTRPSPTTLPSVARRLVAIAPEEAHVSLFRLAGKARRTRGFHRFLKALHRSLRHHQ